MGVGGGGGVDICMKQMGMWITFMKLWYWSTHVLDSEDSNFQFQVKDSNKDFICLYRYTAYRARNLLAMIDYQQHKDRPLALDKDGEPK